MKRSFALTTVCLALMAVPGILLAGPEPYSGKEMKETVAPPPECWYRDNEWNVGVWGAYAFSQTDNNRTGIEDTDDLAIYGTYDRFLSADHAWGGGLDAKYFSHRYFGVGIEGFGLDGRTLHAVLDHGSQAASEERYNVDHHLVGGVLATLTLRYPIGCSRFAPYVWAGGGGIFGGRNDRPVGHDAVTPSLADHFDNGDESRGMGQFGGGLEIRITRHIGVTGDFSWNVLDGPNNNFGMARTGINFAF
jgi:hypothetical protein